MSIDPRLAAFQELAAEDPVAANEVIRQLKRKMFVPHVGQLPIMRSKARFRILRAGRRWGKTKLAAHEVVTAALKESNQMVWWVANSEKNVKRGYRNVLAQLPRALMTKDPPSENANDRILPLTNGSTIEFYTAGTPDSLVGEGVNFLVVDEAALIEESVWLQRLRPTLSDTKGHALIISTPRGRNWFYNVWQRGQEGRAAYASWHYPTWTSPYIDEEEMEDARDTLPALFFAQEYAAEFVANAASIFDIERDNAVVPALQEPYGHLVMGVDLGKQQDFTVLSTARAGDRVPVGFERFNTIAWDQQQTLIEEEVKRLEGLEGVDGVTVVVDSTGLGEVVFDNLDEAGLDVVPVNFSAGQKERMVRLLAADIEHGRARIYEEMRKEFESFEYEITDSGRYKFAAATGHDDMVAAKVLENWGIVHEAPPDAHVYELEKAQHDNYLEDAEGAIEEIRADSPADIMAREEAWH